MSNPLDLTGQHISDTYERIVQTDSGYFYDGLGNTVSIGSGSGSQGPQGWQGPRGDLGTAGVQGPQGWQGPRGDLGTAGVQGFQGFQGFQGSIGAVGTQGFQGFQGTQGFQGSIGTVGTQGFQGFQGFQGSIGTAGVQGFQGFQGSIGAVGTQGFQGFQGFQGSIGTAGVQGFQGVTGPGATYYTQSPPAPSSPNPGDRWYDLSTGLEYVYINDGNSSQWVTPSGDGAGGSGGGGTPGGLDTYVQYNNSSAFGGDANFVYNYSTSTLTITGALTVGSSGPVANIDSANRSLYANDGTTLAVGYTDPRKVESQTYPNSEKSVVTQELVSSSFWYAGDVIQVGKVTGVALFDVVYLNNIGAGWTVVDQSSATSTNLLGILVSTSPALVLLEGHIVVSDNNTGAPGVDSLTQLGVPIYLMERISTDPYMTTVVPTTGYVRILGYSYRRNVGTNTHLWLMKFRPDNTWVQI